MSGSGKVRAAVIGLGAWGACHAEVLNSIAEAELVAVCDRRPGRLEEMAALCPGAQGYTDYAEILKRDDIDLISVVTPGDMHLAPVLGALEAGIHVLVEKPVSTSVDDARAMQAAAEKNGRFLVPGHILRYEARYAEAFEIVRRGEIGVVASIYSRRPRPRSQYATYNDIHPVFGIMTHDIDLALWYAGDRVKRVRAVERNIQGGPKPDLLWACLEFEGGALAMLQSIWCLPDAVRVGGRPDVAEILGDKGMLNLDASADGIEQWDDSGAHSPDLALHRTYHGRTSGALTEQYGMLCRCVQTGETPTVAPFADAIHGIEIAWAICEAAQSGQTVEINGDYTG